MWDASHPEGLSRLSSNHEKYIFQGLSSNYENVTHITLQRLDTAPRAVRD